MTDSCLARGRADRRTQLGDLDIAPAARHPPLLRQLALLENAVHQSSRQPPDIRFAMRPDSQGIGPAASRTGDVEHSPDHQPPPPPPPAASHIFRNKSEPEHSEMSTQ